MITLQNIHLRRGTKSLLEDLSLTIYARQKIGLVGDNGCGKSSLFSLLQGDLEAHQGTLIIPNQLRLVHVKQEISSSQQSAIDYVIDGDTRYRQLEQTLHEAEKTHDAGLLAQCHDELANIDGYAIKGRAEKILKGLGFLSSQVTRSVSDFSGGWRMRLNLAQALIAPSDIMLLDEPTNHLDIDAIIWLERWLEDYTGTLLIISHDREFLDNIVSSILHFHNQQLRLYSGNYSAFEQQRLDQLMIQQATFDKQQAKISHMQKFIDRFGAKASKAKQAQSRVKALERLEKVAAVKKESTLQFKFREPTHCPNPLLKVDHACVSYTPSTLVLDNVELQLAPSDRIGLLGVNGAGKSTLIKLIAGKLQPISGAVHLYKGIKIGYFAQHQIEHLELEGSPLTSLQQLAPQENEQNLRNFLGSFNFRGTMATEKIITFSGGEKARLALALIIWQAPNLLLLDEPTNHLDMNMREALILALQDYTGALILVSHDRYLLRTTTNELMLLSNKSVERFQGDLDDYKQIFLKQNSQNITQQKGSKQNPGKDRRKIETRIQTIEQRLTELQQREITNEALLAAAYESKDHTEIATYQKQQEEIRKKIQEAEIAWLELTTQLEQL